MKKLFIILVFTSLSIVTLNSQWKSCNGPYGGFINCLTINGDFIYAGTPTGVFLSSDNGENWIQKNHGLISNVSSIVISGNNIFAGSNGGFYTGKDDFTKSGIYLSTDNGESWIQKNHGLPDTINVTSLAICGNYLFAGTKQNIPYKPLYGIYLSTDNGENWIQKNAGLTSLNISTIFVKGNSIFIGTDDGIFISTNYGDSWTLKNSGIPENTTITSFATKGNDIIVGTWDGIFLSTNDGYDWEKTKYGISWAVLSLAIIDNYIFAGTSSTVCLSTDNGDNWVQKGQGFFPSSTAKTAFAVKDNNIFAGSNGIFLSTNKGEYWNQKGLDFRISKILKIGISENNIIAGTVMGGLILSTDDGFSWNQKNYGINNTDALSLLLKGNNIFVGFSDGNVILSTDNGNSWSKRGKCPSGIFALAVSGDKLIAGTEYNGLFFSTDDGLSWTPKNYGLNNLNIRSLIVKGNNILVGTWDGVFISNNDGDYWISKSSGLPNNTAVMTFAIKDDNIFIGTFNGEVYLSNDNGDSWIQKSSGLGNIYTMAICGNIIFAGGTGMIFSSDNGNTWNPSYTGFIIRTIIINGNSVFTGGHTNWGDEVGSGVLRSDIRDIIYPKISSISDLDIDINSIAKIEFNISGYNEDSLNISIESSNLALLPLDSIILTGIGGYIKSTENTKKKISIQSEMLEKKYELSLHPVKNMYGESLIKITVSDGLNDSTSIFKFTVKKPGGDIKISGETSVCKEQEVIYSTDSFPNFTYNWTVTNGEIINQSDQLKCKVKWTKARNGFVKLVRTNSQVEYKDSLSLPVFVEDLPNVTLTLVDNICIDSGILTLDGGLPSGGIYSGTAVTGNTFNPLIAGVGSHSIKYKYTSSSGCSSEVTKDITVIEKPDKPTITQNENELTSSSSTGNQWYLNGVEITGAMGQKFTPIETGYYQVKTTINGCTSEFSDEKFVQVNSVKDNTNLFVIQVIPNPTSDKLTLSQIPEGVVSYEIFDYLGQIVSSGSMNGEIDVSSLPTGVYFLKFNNQKPLKFIKI